MWSVLSCPVILLAQNLNWSFIYTVQSSWAAYLIKETYLSVLDVYDRYPHLLYTYNNIQGLLLIRLRYIDSVQL